MSVMNFEFVTVTLQQRRPVEPLWDDRRTGERGLGLLVRHLQEQQIGELLEVVAVRKPVVTEDVAVAPQPLHQTVRRDHARTLRRFGAAVSTSSARARARSTDAGSS